MAIDISKKVLIITLLIFTVLTASFTFTHNMQLSNFLELERADTFENVERVQNAVATEQSYLDYIVQDWACWDDTYQFIEDKIRNTFGLTCRIKRSAGLM